MDARPGSGPSVIAIGPRRPRRRDGGGALQLVFQPQRGERRADVVVDLARGALAVEAPQHTQVLVVLHERLRLLVVDLEPVLDGLRLVVVALDELRAVLVTD